MSASLRIHRDCRVRGLDCAPGHYRDRVNPQDVATAEGFMLMVAGIEGFVPPVIFSIIGIVFALIGVAAREPKRVSMTAQEPIASLEVAFEPHHS